MDVSEFVKLTSTAIADLIEKKSPSPDHRKAQNRRNEARWPFRGTVELWIPNESGNETHVLATALNISLSGIAILSDGELCMGQSMAIAVHLPEATYYGRAATKHTTESPVGHIVGLQFEYDN
jgi:hypothetical protein